MIKKYRQEPEKIKQLQAIIRRLPPNHFILEKVRRELAIAQAGYRGEQMIDYYMNFLPKNKYYIFQHLRLQSSPEHYFQIDNVLVSPNVIFLLEVKNIAGTLYFDDHFKQCIRTDGNGKEEGFANPIYQIDRQCSQLVEWLQKNKIPEIPIYPLVVIAQPSTIIKSSSSHIADKVIHAATIPTIMNHIQAQHKKERLNEQDLRRLTRIFIKKHTDLTTNYVQHFEINIADLITGVPCPQCYTFSMMRHRGKWFCATCEFRSADAHVQALADYRLLFNTTLNNKQLRDFLHITTSYEASRILRQLDFPSTGEKKNRVYEIPSHIVELAKNNSPSI